MPFHVNFVLYLILIHHQTTTVCLHRRRVCGLYLILIHHQTTTHPCICPISPWLYLILIHHQTTTKCKLQQRLEGLYLILIHHQTTTVYIYQSNLHRCISSLFITKPQRYGGGPSAFDVVSHPYSSPNHNKVFPILCPHMVVSHPYSSPNHNSIGPVLARTRVVSHPYSSPNHNWCG